MESEKDALKGRYDKISADWNSSSYEQTRGDGLVPVLFEYSGIKNGDVVLDAMCGTGKITEEVLRTFPDSEIYALDFSPGMLSKVSSEAHKVESSVTHTPFEDNFFDRIFIRSALYDLPIEGQKAALKEMYRVLKPGGTFTLQTFVTGGQLELEEKLKTDPTMYIYSHKLHSNLANFILKMRDDLAGYNGPQEYSERIVDGYIEQMSESYTNQSGQFTTNEPRRYIAPFVEMREWIEELGASYKSFYSLPIWVKVQNSNELTDEQKKLFAYFFSHLPKHFKHNISLSEYEKDRYSFSLDVMFIKITKDKK